MRIGNKDFSEAKLRVLIVDDHRLILDVLLFALDQEAGLSVDVALSYEEAIDKIHKSGRFDVILLDYQLPGIVGLDALRNLSKENEGNVALFSGVASWPVVKNAMEHGACGYVPKSTPIKTLSHAIQFIAGGEIYLPYEYMRQMSSDYVDDIGLKPRERYVLAFLCEGLQNKEIAREVSVSEVIVKMDVKSICRKLGVRNRTEAVIEARKRGVY
jgi:two-component system, NarL family, nitrate/nitrite response regulator NarL